MSDEQAEKLVKALDRIVELLESDIQAKITERLIAFHQALIERGQIPRPEDQHPVSIFPN